VPPGNRGRSLLLGVSPRTGPAGEGARPGPPADVLLDAVEAARASAGLTVDEVGILLTDAAAEADLLEPCRSRGFAPVAVVEAADLGTFAFRHGDDFARHVESLGADLASARLRWHPEDDADRKKAQALGLTKLAAWLHETDRRLLVEVVVPAAPEGDDAGADPALVLDAIREIRDLGTEADLWAVPHLAAVLPDLAAFARDEGRDAVALLDLVMAGGPPDDVTAAAGDGIVLDHDAWWTPALASGAGDDGGAVAATTAAITGALGMAPPTAEPLT
jgi:hypothetical protein